MLGSSKTRAIALLAAVFIAGAAGGWAGRDWSGREHRRGRRHGGERMVQVLSRKLDLTAAQKDSVRAIFERRRSEFDALWKDVHPRYDSLRTAVEAEVGTQLTPAQRERYAALIVEFEKRREERGDRRGDPR